MKINIFFLGIIIFFLNCSKIIAEEVIFNAEKINIEDNGNKINAINSETTIEENNIKINSKRVNYNKKTNIIIFTDKVYFHDKNENLIIESDKIKYNRKSEIINSYGPTKFILKNKFLLNSSDIFFERIPQIIYGDGNSVLEDSEKNIFKLNDKFKFDLKNELIKSENSIILDKDGNNYLFEDLVVNLKTNEIAGKEIEVKFNKSLFGNKKNDPLLKGRSSYSSDEELKVYKAVFSTCNIENKKCRGWELSTDEFKHDKKKKIFEYKNSWLKIFDYKIFYVPYFNHPDPSVKRKSGFLTPSYTSSDTLGISINTPYFKVLDKDKDITFSPRYYADKSFLLQNEYRQALEKSKILSDLSFLVGDAGTKGHFFYNQIGELSDKISFELNLQNVKGDNFLKTHKIIETSSLIKSDSLLVSGLDLDFNFTDSKLNTSFKIFEDLSRNYHDRYQYIFPDFNFTKQIIIPNNYNGNFNFNSYGYNKLYNTNVTETVLTNDFLFESIEFINSKGIITDYDLLLKNSNNYSNNSNTFDDNFNYNLFGLVKLDLNYPMQKQMVNYTNFLKPILSLRYSPNGNTDLSSKDVMLKYNNVFDINRIGETSQVEGGESLSLGLEFKSKNKKGLNILDAKVAHVLKADENHTMPLKSKLNKKRSDIFGNINFGITDNTRFGYFFSYDKDLKYSNLDQIDLDWNLNNFFTNISYYYEHNDLLEKESIKNKSELKFNNENKLSFEISKDLTQNFTQYYDLIFTHQTDCISLNLSFNRSFYSDGSLEPSQSLSFLVKIIPFTELGVTNLGNLVGN